MRTNESTELGKRETSSPSENRIRQLTLVSGKGGTGKTTITAAFASLAQNAVLADCDVDAADLHLILSPQIETQEEFYGGKVAAAPSAVPVKKCVASTPSMSPKSIPSPARGVRFVWLPVRKTQCPCETICPVTGFSLGPGMVPWLMPNSASPRTTRASL
jgi:MinD superfamily P-loop ATPase